MKKLFFLLFLVTLGCGSLQNSVELVPICPDQFAQIPSKLMEKSLFFADGCPEERDPDIPEDIDTNQVIPWGIERVNGPLLKTNRTVWIIDTGIDLDNPELNIDYDRSVSFVELDGQQIFSDDGYGHGTHVAGTIAAIDNDFGVVGIAPGQLVVAVKVLSDYGWGRHEWVEAGIRYVADNANPGDVVNMSLGASRSEDTLGIENAVQEAADKGILFAVSAGNDHGDANNKVPATVDHPNVFTVSASDVYDCRASFSNFGQDVEFAAPGVAVLSTFKDGNYKIWQGTSMAAPHIAGLLLFGSPQESGLIRCGFSGLPADTKQEPIASY
jgi:subtilisin family serine protease